MKRRKHVINQASKKPKMRNIQMNYFQNDTVLSSEELFGPRNENLCVSEVVYLTQKHNYAIHPLVRKEIANTFLKINRRYSQIFILQKCFGKEKNPNGINSGNK